MRLVFRTLGYPTALAAMIAAALAGIVFGHLIAG